MLLAIEAFFLYGRDKLTIFYDRGGGITVIGVYTQNIQADNSELADWIYREMTWNPLQSSLR